MLRSKVFSTGPSKLCPFHVEAIQYLPNPPDRAGLTLVFLHATNMHKESYEPVLNYLLSAPGLRVKDVWCIENPNHGASALHNCSLLETPEYRENWTAHEYMRAVQAFLTSAEHGINFRARKLVGIAHSAASAPLLLLQRASPPIPFAGLVFMDAAILPIGTRPTKFLCTLFGNWAKSKPHTWASREEARRDLARAAFRGWDPLAVDLFVRHATRPIDEADKDGVIVTLSCSTKQEAAYYLSPAADLVKEPTEIFAQLVNADQLPIHTIICLNDEYKGKGTEMKLYQIDSVQKMRNGSVQIIEGGHMFPQTRPEFTAQAIGKAVESIQVQVFGDMSVLSRR